MFFVRNSVMGLRIFYAFERVFYLMEENKIEFNDILPNSQGVSRSESLKYTPINDCEWKSLLGTKGVRGTCRCYPIKKRDINMLKKYGVEYINYNSYGEPDFSKVAEVSVKISDMSDSRPKNFASAYKKILKTKWAEDRKLKTANDVKEYCRKKKLTLHEVRDGVTMEVVPRDIHEMYRHQGGVSIVSRLNSDVEGVDKVSQSIANVKIKFKKRNVKLVEELQEGTPEVIEVMFDETSKSMAKGKEAAFMSLTVSTVNNIVLIAQGEKDIDQAVKDIVRDTGGTFVATAGIDMLQNALKESAKKIPNEALSNILSKDLPIQQISSAVMIGNSIVKYINDDISAEECMTEILLNGLGAIAYSIGSLGGPVGIVISTIVVGQINKSIIEYQQQAKIDREKERRLINLTKEALYTMEKQRKELIEMVEEQNFQFHNIVNGGFEKIFTSALQNDVEGIAVGLDNILSTVNKNVMFKSLEEYDRHFYSEEVFEF